jgi:hypothetical protein
MGFTLRQVSYSADGREIIRTSKVRDDELTIGRDPTCDVRLTDLAVALHHATLERVSPTRVGVSSESGLKFELDGRSVTFGQIDLGTGGDIRIGTHLLRIMPTSPASQEVQIQIEKVVEGEVKLDKDEEERFSLASVMPTKRFGAWAFTFLILGLFLAWPIKSFYDRQQGATETAAAAGPAGAAVTPAAAGEFHADEMWSSGPLSQGHAALENDCKACHIQPFEAVTDQACLACHTAIHDHADPFRLARAAPDITGWGKVKLAFQETFNIPPGRCVECHTEHEGSQQMVPTAQQFCSDCHQSLDSKLPDTQLANAGDFGTSHPEFQPAVLMRWNGDRPMLQRVSLASKPTEMSNLKFPHDMHLSKTNGVAQMARRLSAEHGFGQALDCKDCHDATADGVRFQPVNMEEDCGMCHSLAFDTSAGTLRTLRHGDPAQVVADLRDMFRARAPSPAATLGGMSRRRPGDEMMMRNVRQFRIGTGAGRAERAIKAVFSPGGACYDCHVIEPPAPGTLNYEVKPVAFPIRYMHKGWFDHKAHATETCVSCHQAPTSDASSDLLLPDLASCRTCHGGESARNVDVPSGCAMCHDYHMDQGTPSMLLRQRDKGKSKDTVVASTETRTRTAAR